MSLPCISCLPPSTSRPSFPDIGNPAPSLRLLQPATSRGLLRPKEETQGQEGVRIFLKPGHHEQVHHRHLRPRNLLEQFRRIANIFFLAIAILQFFPLFNTVSPGLVILPLIIVLAITAIKDGYEDIKRHQSDRAVNYSQVRVLAGTDNPNAMQAKSKTFVRAIVPKFRARKSKKGAHTTEVAMDAAGREYDDDIEEMAGLFHIRSTIPGLTGG
ncbi:hypothetical protein A0H81_10942 [Grifola frondosa]|uniref:P-type ATPase N-terminal domain-containing protein n=1 Tax=Grifola frondosa TaxID=5627 RepID=A0A1C7LYL4_GRIFR|nr:hypothetical protein A0H81_10942 [Grifola frondosa]